MKNSISIVLAGKGPNMSILLKNGILPPGEEDKINAQAGINIKKNDLFFINSLGARFYYTQNLLRPKNGWEWESLYTLKKLESNYGSFLCEALGKFWEMMPDFETKLSFVELPELFLKKEFLEDSNEEIVFFPGSFNPWHEGHLACLNLCPNKSKIIVIPDNNPWKSKKNGSLGCKWERYKNLCLILKDTPYSVYPGFMGLDNENPTVSWFPNIKAAQKALLMGDDSFLTLLNWKDSNNLIVTIDRIYLVPRTAKKEELDITYKKLLEVNPELKMELLPVHDYQEISSTKIRGT